jgi:hypothetical protein
VKHTKPFLLSMVSYPRHVSVGKINQLRMSYVIGKRGSQHEWESIFHYREYCHSNLSPTIDHDVLWFQTQPTSHLDGKHVVFGEVIRGKSVG